MNVDELVVSYKDWIFRQAKFYYRNPDDALDLAGDTIYRCLQRSHQFDRSKDFKPWALTIMANIYITDMKRRKCVPFDVTDEIDRRISQDSADSRLIFRQIVAEMRKCARNYIGAECLLMYIKGYDYSEIAESQNITVGTVKSRIYSLRNALRKVLNVSKC